MSRLLNVQWHGLAPKLIHGRRPDRPQSRRTAGVELREGPLWNRAPHKPESSLRREEQP